MKRLHSALMSKYLQAQKDIQCISRFSRLAAISLAAVVLLITSAKESKPFLGQNELSHCACL